MSLRSLSPARARHRVASPRRHPVPTPRHVPAPASARPGRRRRRRSCSTIPGTANKRPEPPGRQSPQVPSHRRRVCRIYRCACRSGQVFAQPLHTFRRYRHQRPAIAGHHHRQCVIVDRSVPLRHVNFRSIRPLHDRPPPRTRRRSHPPSHSPSCHRGASFVNRAGTLEWMHQHTPSRNPANR